MSKRRFVFYIIVLIITFAVLTTLVLKKYFFKPIGFNNNQTIISVLKNNISERTSPVDTPSPEPTPDFRLPGGREDPFALLPEEEALKVLAVHQIPANSGLDVSTTPAPIPGSPIQEPVFPNDIYVRGIIIGTTSQAYVEEKTDYKTIVAGDWIAGGKVLRITKEGVYIEWNKREIWLKPAY